MVEGIAGVGVNVLEGVNTRFAVAGAALIAAAFFAAVFLFAPIFPQPLVSPQTQTISNEPIALSANAEKSSSELFFSSGFEFTKIRNQTYVLSFNSADLAEVELVSSSPAGCFSCEAVIRVKPFTNVNVPSSNGSQYGFSFVKKFSSVKGVSSYSTALGYNVSKNVTDWVSNCVEIINATHPPFANCTWSAVGSHIQSDLVFNESLFGASLRANRDYFVKLSAFKHAQLGNTDVDWRISLFGFEISQWAWWDANYLLKAKRFTNVTLSVAADLTNYPLFVNQSTTALIAASKLRADCNDYAFVNGSEDTQLSCELEKNTCNTGETTWWVLQPFLHKQTANDTFYDYYNYAAGTAQCKAYNSAVWPSATYNLSYNFGENSANGSTAGFANDSSSAANNCTFTGAGVALLGFIKGVHGYGLNWSNSAVAACVASKSAYGASAGTVDFWFRLNGAPSGLNYIVYDASGGYLYMKTMNASGHLACVLYDGGAKTAVATSNFSFGVWHHVGCTWDGVTLRLYEDGVLNSSVAAGSLAAGFGAYRMGVGMSSAGGSPPMSIDELRVHKITQGADYFRAQYNGVALSWGAEESNSVAPYVVNITNPANGTWRNEWYLNVTGICQSETTPLVNVSFNFNGSSVGNSSAVTNNTAFYFNQSVGADGTYWYNITCNSTAALSNTSELRYLNIDATSPVIGFNAATQANNSNVSQNYIYANWSANDTNFNVSYAGLYYANGTWINTTYGGANSSINWTGLWDDVFIYEVFANDSAGNAADTNRTIVLDTTPPVIAINYPVNFSTIYVPYGDGFSINGTVTDAFLSSIVTNHSNYTGYDTSSPFNFSNTTTIPNYNLVYSVNVTANDSAGNTALAQVYFTLYSSNFTLTSNLTMTAALYAPAGMDGFDIGTTGVQLDCAGFGIYGNGSGIGVAVDTANDIRILNCYVQNFSDGFSLDTTNNSYFYNDTAYNTTLSGLSALAAPNDYATVYNSNFSYGVEGIDFQRPSYLKIQNNTFLMLASYPIVLLNAPNVGNLIYNNILTNFTIGISTASATFNNISYNTLTNGSWGIELQTSTNNTINSNTISYMSSRGIYLRLASDNNTIDYDTLRFGTLDGLIIDGSDNNTVFGLNASYNGDNGVEVAGTSENTTFSNATAHNNANEGFLVQHDYNWIYNSLAYYNVESGVYLDDGDFNNVSYSNLSYNTNNSIVSSLGTNNTIFFNNLTAVGTANASMFYGASNNTVENNTIAAVNGVGIEVDRLSDSNSFEYNLVRSTGYDAVFLQNAGYFVNSFLGGNYLGSYGFYFSNASNFSLTLVNVSFCANDGLFVRAGSDNNTVFDSDVYNNLGNGIALNSSFNNVSYNNVSYQSGGAGYFNIYLQNAANNTVSFNELRTGVGGYSAGVSESDYNQIFNNTIMSDSDPAFVFGLNSAFNEMDYNDITSTNDYAVESLEVGYAWNNFTGGNYRGTYGVVFVNTSNVSFISVNVSFCAFDAFNFDANSENNTIFDSEVYNNTDDGVVFAGDFNNVSYNNIYYIFDNAVETTSDYNAVLSNLIFNNTGVGVWLNGGDYNNVSYNDIQNQTGGEGVYVNATAAYNNVSWNTFFQNVNSIVVYGTATGYNTLFSNVADLSAGSHIYITDGDYDNVSYNNLTRAGNNGIALYGVADYNQIAHNNVSFSGEDGVLVSGTSIYANVSINTLFNNTQNGISVEGCDYGNYSYNVIYQNTLSGIETQTNTSFSNFTFNTIYNNTMFGMNVSGATYNYILNNSISNHTANGYGNLYLQYITTQNVIRYNAFNDSYAHLITNEFAGYNQIDHNFFYNYSTYFVNNTNITNSFDTLAFSVAPWAAFAQGNLFGDVMNYRMYDENLDDWADNIGGDMPYDNAEPRWIGFGNDYAPYTTNRLSGTPSVTGGGGGGATRLPYNGTNETIVTPTPSPDAMSVVAAYLAGKEAEGDGLTVLVNAVGGVFTSYKEFTTTGTNYALLLLGWAVLAIATARRTKSGYGEEDYDFGGSFVSALGIILFVGTLVIVVSAWNGAGAAAAPAASTTLQNASTALVNQTISFSVGG